MELALYDSLEGYYVSDRLKVGREGDFFTNVSVGPVFGEILAGQFLEMWSILGEPNDFTIVEQGANDGQLARDVIMALAGTPLESARWIIVEPLESLRVKQSHLLANAHVCWVSSSYYLPPFCGVHFSNELFDALPFDIIEAHDGKWRELLVGSQGEDFVFCPNPNFIVGTPLPPRPDADKAKKNSSRAYRAPCKRASFSRSTMECRAKTFWPITEAKGLWLATQSTDETRTLSLI